MKSIIGYTLSGLGILALALSQEGIKSSIKFLEVIPSKAILAVGAFLVIGGVVMLVLANKTTSKPKHAKEEVPIYEGTGKNRKIVAYRKD